MQAMSHAPRSRGQPSRGRRSGAVFCLRLSESELADVCREKPPHVAVGTWAKTLLLSDQQGRRRGNTEPGAARAGNTNSSPDAARIGITRARSEQAERGIILDLCAGTGAWSEPYARAGYDVRRVTLPAEDVRVYEPPEGVRGVLAAPPCEAFSLARNGTPASEDELTCGLGVVAACLRVIALACPVWWALENPVGRLGHALGRPAFTFQPWWWGDAWTKRTSLWGNFRRPHVTIGAFVRPGGSAAARASVTERSRTPSGFARAFFEANP